MGWHRINPAFQRLITETNGEAALASLRPLPGLSGQSLKGTGRQGAFIARPAPWPAIPFVNRQREFRLLKKLQPSGLTPGVLAGNRHGVVLRWQSGEMIAATELTERLPQVIALLRQLHRQPLTGYRLELLPLLWQYWQQCQQRHYGWLRELRRLTRLGEPRPLRLAPLHLDVHVGNLIAWHKQLYLIDWEYAADGDVALELAVICGDDPDRQARWLTAYAQVMQLPPDRLRRQVKYWQPWLRLLMASWYQLRAEQSGDKTLQQLARQSWEQI